MDLRHNHSHWTILHCGWFQKIGGKVYRHTWKSLIMRVLFYFTIAQEGADSEQTEEDTSDESSHSDNEVSEDDN